jgi:L-lactate dehydrogenase complex protein LldG
MSARDDILASVRRALAQADTTPVPVPVGYRTRPGAGDVEVVDLFAERVADYRAVVERCTPQEVADRIAAALGTSATVVPPALPWPVAGAGVDDGFSTAELDRYDAVVTAATLGIAETGTLVLTHGPGQGRRALTLVPDLHVCVVHAGDIVADVPAAVRLLDPDRPQTWISGPSATSDIELTRVEGVHGPRTLHLIILD